MGLPDQGNPTGAALVGPPSLPLMPRPATSPVPSGTTFETDLRAIREAKGLSLSDIQQQTRIPVDVLRRFEEGELVADPTYNEVYLKAFLQSYAKAVGMAPSKVIAAYGEQKAGAYNGGLHPESAPADSSPASPERSAPEPEASPESTAPRAGVPTPEPPARESRPPDPTPQADEPEPPKSAASSAPPAVQALQKNPPSDTRSAPKEPAKTLAQARVNRPAVPSARRSFDKNWTTILALFALVVVALGLAFYFLIWAGDESDADPAEDTVAVGVDAETPVDIDSSGIGAGAAAGGPQLQFPLQAVVTAGGDGLQSFRVTTDDGDRRPYWIEVGVSETFEADSVLILWGEDPTQDFSEATVEIQGQRFTPQSGQPLRIDRQSGQRLLDSLATAPSAPAPTGGTPPAEDPEAFE